jgi:hypothetical protein
LDSNAAAANCRLPSPVEHFDGQHIRRRQNAGARLRFCPLQGLEFVFVFLGVRPKRGVGHRDGRKNAFSDALRIMVAFTTARRTEPLLARLSPNLAAAVGTPYRRITPMNAIARRRAFDYFCHVQFPFAGCALQRGPAFSLPGSGSIDW